MHSLLGGRNQLLPLLGAERFIELACVVLNLLYALAQIGSGAARSRRRIVEFMGKPGRRKLDEELISERSRGIRAKRMQSEVILAKARGELIPKAMAQQQAAHLLVSLRQKILSVPNTHARRILGLTDHRKAQEVLRAIMISLLGELQDLPEKVTDPEWLRELDDGK